jgi:transcriptional regulator with XRE-family HTH domain
LVPTTVQELKQRAESRRVLPAPEERRRIRKDAGATLEEVAEVVGVTRQTVILWENGSRSPSGERLTRYMDLLRVLQEATTGTPT